MHWHGFGICVALVWGTCSPVQSSSHGRWRSAISLGHSQKIGSFWSSRAHARLKHVQWLFDVLLINSPTFLHNTGPICRNYKPKKCQTHWGFHWVFLAKFHQSCAPNSRNWWTCYLFLILILLNLHNIPDNFFSHKGDCVNHKHFIHHWKYRGQKGRISCKISAAWWILAESALSWSMTPIFLLKTLIILISSHKYEKCELYLHYKKQSH